MKCKPASIVIECSDRTKPVRLPKRGPVALRITTPDDRFVGGVRLRWLPRVSVQLAEIVLRGDGFAVQTEPEQVEAGRHGKRRPA